MKAELIAAIDAEIMALMCWLDQRNKLPLGIRQDMEISLDNLLKVNEKAKKELSLIERIAEHERQIEENQRRCRE